MNPDPPTTGDTHTADSAEGAVDSAPEAVEEAAELDTAELRAALEAILLVVDEPVADTVLAEVLQQPVSRVAATLEELSAEYTAAGRGFDLRRAAGGWRFYTRAQQAPYVERFVLDGQQARLSKAALETLAVVAYQQPVTRSRVAAVRGVNCDGVIRTLLTRGLVAESGTEPETGARLYCTTSVFLEKLGLDSLAQLPALAPLLPEDVTGFDPDPRPAADHRDHGDDSAPDIDSHPDIGDADNEDGVTDGGSLDGAEDPDRADGPDSVDTPDLDLPPAAPPAAPAPPDTAHDDDRRGYAAEVEDVDAAR